MYVCMYVCKIKICVLKWSYIETCYFNFPYLSSTASMHPYTPPAWEGPLLYPCPQVPAQHLMLLQLSLQRQRWCLLFPLDVSPEMLFYNLNHNTIGLLARQSNKFYHWASKARLRLRNNARKTKNGKELRNQTGDMLRR